MNESNAQFARILESLPWRLADECYQKEPEWLAVARRRAANAALELSNPERELNNQEILRRETSNPPTSGPVRKIARWIRTANRLPTIADTDEENASPSRNELDVEGEYVAGQKRRDKQVHGEHPENADIASPSGRRHMNRSRSFDSEYSDSFRTAPNIPSEVFSSGTDSFKTAHQSDTDSFKTARQSSFATSKNEATADHKSSSNKRERSGSDRSVPFGESYASGQETDESVDPAASSPNKTLRGPPVPLRRSSDQTEVHSNRSLEGLEDDIACQPIEGASDSRLARMESIIEKLLLFSSEQALNNLTARQAPQATDSPSNQFLLEQISKLQLQVERQNRVEKEAHLEIENLRQRISELTEMFTERTECGSARDSRQEVAVDREYRLSRRSIDIKSSQELEIKENTDDDSVN